MKIPESPVVRVAAASGFLGFVVGMFGYGTWQVAVESAQVVAGLVHYPRDNPFYVYHVKLWTLSHQLSAALLWLGLSEAAVSLLISGLLGAISFQALSLAALALSRDALLAIGTPFFVEWTRANMFWIAYPVWLLGTTHTYGVLGLSAALLVVSLFANGCRGAGFLGLGLMPAVHPSLGAWLWVLVALTFLLDFREARRTWRTAVRPFLAGCALSATSLLVHLLFTYDVPKADAATSHRLLLAFVRLWDGHRQPIALSQEAVHLALGTGALALAWRLVVKSSLPLPAHFLLRFTAVCSALGTALIVVSWQTPESIPVSLLVLMPNRLLNLNVLAAPALLLGLLGSSAAVALRVQLALWVVLGALLPLYFGVWYPGENNSMHPAYANVAWPDAWLFQGIVVAAAGLLASAAALSRRLVKPGRLSVGLRVVALLALGGIVIGTLARTVDNWHSHERNFVDFRNDPLLARVASDPGLLATSASLHLIQLRTRRPVLVDGGGLDFLAYAPETGPVLDVLLKRVYEVDLLAPPEGAAGTGEIPAAHNRRVWEGRTLEEWKTVGHELGITGVLTYPDWALQLPLAGRNDAFAYYVID